VTRRPQQQSSACRCSQSESTLCTRSKGSDGLQDPGPARGRGRRAGDRAGGAKQRTLLAILLLHRNEVVSTERLLEDLYGADQPATAQKSLQAHVSRLRKVLGADRLLTRGSGYVLETGSEEVDADRFVRRLDAGRGALASGDASGSELALAEALSLWRGAPLDDVSYEAFAQSEIARLEELRVACMEALCEARLALGRHAELVGALERLTSEHPHRERLRSLQMFALYRSGRQADALAAYRDARRVLRDELGLEPSRALQELEQAILRQEPDLDYRPDGRVLADEPTQPPVTPASHAREARKTVTAVFFAVRTWSEHGDRLDPEALRRVTALAFDELRDAVERHGGSVETITSAGLSAVFGVPVVHEDDALRALRAADEARSRLTGLADGLAGAHRARLHVTVGVSTGEVIAGGSDAAQPRATGEPLTTSSRLGQEGDAGDIVLDEATTRVTRHAAIVEPAALGSERALRVVELTVGQRATRRFESEMVGRERERRRLRDAFEQATSDRSCQLFTILGPAGVGKSRLVREFLRDIAGQATVGTGRCLPYGEGITYWPVVEVVKDLAGLDDAESPELSQLRLLALLDGIGGSDAVVQRVAQTIGASAEVAAVEESSWAIRTLFETLASRRPLVVVFDDVHWGETTFLDLVEDIAEQSRDAPLLLVCMARPELVEVRPAWGGGKLNATSVLLEPLSDRECARLIGNLVGETEITADVRSRIAEAAEGNPLFVEEMLSMLVDDGLLVREDGRWAATRDLGRVPVPPTIQALLAARLDQLDPDERTTIEAAAVEGKVFHQGSIESLAPNPSAVPTSLAALVRKELVRPEPSVFSGERAFRFRHLLIRDAAYEAIPKQVRAVLHERHVCWLEDTIGDGSVEYEEIIGYHLEQAFRYRADLGAVDDASRALGRRAAERLGTAGRRAFQRSDAAAGANLVSRAATLLSPSDPLRVELVPNVRTVQGRTDLSWADRVLTEAVEAAATTGDRRLAAHALVQRGFLRLFTGSAVDAPDLIDVANRAITAFDAIGDELGLARAWRLVAQAHYLDHRVAASAAASEQALEHVRLAGDPFEEGEIVEWLVIALLLGPAHASVAIPRCEQLVEETAGRPLLQAQILGALAPLLAMQGKAAEADEVLARGRRIMEAAGEWIWIVSFWRSMVHLWRNDALAAERELRPGYEALKRIGERSHFSSLAHGLANALYMQGRYDETERLTRECEEACRPNDVHSHILWRSTRAKVLARREELDGAMELARDALVLAEQGDFLPAHAGAQEDFSKVLYMAGRTAEARLAMEEAIRLYDEKGNHLAADRARALNTRS
jgi:DNA-binding SARP family transcriptional activator